MVRLGRRGLILTKPKKYTRFSSSLQISDDITKKHRGESGGLASDRRRIKGVLLGYLNPKVSYVDF